MYAHNHCHEEQSSQQDKPPLGRALEMLQARPPADCVLLKGPLDSGVDGNGILPHLELHTLIERHADDDQTLCIHPA